jgi:trimethylamine:corrinoid methyltransferase-like protein
MAMVLGSPEDLLLQFSNAEVNAYFHGTSWYPGVGSIHTSAKLPDAQACAEKANLMTTGTLLGVRRFGVAGTLSLDEVFSPEQLLYDIEIRDHAQRIAKGIDGDCDPGRCLEDVMESIQQKSFVGLDTTVNTYRDVYWHPRLFERQFLAGWDGEGAKTIREKAHAMILELLNEYEYELETELRRELDQILAKAKQDFRGG